MLGGLDAFWWALRWGAPASARSLRSHPFDLCRWFAARGILRAVKVDVVWGVDAKSDRMRARGCAAPPNSQQTSPLGA